MSFFFCCCKVSSYAVVHTYYTREIYTFKIIKKTEVAYSELHAYISQQGYPQSFVSNDTGCCYVTLKLLDSTKCENDEHITEELVCSAWQSRQRLCKCISHTISHGNTRTNIVLHLVQDILVERVHSQSKESWFAFCVSSKYGQCSDLFPKHPKKFKL
jgi:hypothetical protein